MKKIIVVGASRVGIEVAKRISNSALIEADPAKYMILKRENPDRDIYGGDARLPETLMRAGIENAEALVLVTNKDYVNLKVALAASEFSVPKIVSRYYDERYRQDLKDAGVTHLISPKAETLDAILEHVFPEKEIITDIVITKESPVFGKTVGDIQLPANCVVGAVLKSGKLCTPSPELALEEGDTISLVSLGEVDIETYEILAGGFTPYIPHEKIIFLLLSSADIGALSEVASLANKLNIVCEVVFGANNKKLKAQAIVPLEKSGCEYTFNEMSGDVMTKFLSYVSGFESDSGVMVSLHQAKRGLFSHLVPWSYIKWLLNKSKPPLLIARGNEYERILHLLDSTRVGERCTRTAVGLAINTTSKLFALSPHSSGSIEHDIVRAHTTRMARIHNIDVVEDIIEGDPTIELVQKVRSEPSQLVLLHWEDPTIRKDILVRIINDAEASVLLVGRQGKL